MDFGFLTKRTDTITKRDYGNFGNRIIGMYHFTIPKGTLHYLLIEKKNGFVARYPRASMPQNNFIPISKLLLSHTEQSIHDALLCCLAGLG